MPQLLVQVVSVNALAAGATVVVAHTLESNGVAVAPTYVAPDRTTSIRVVSVSTTGITCTNTGLSTASANFRLERGWQPEVDAFTVTPLLWQGGGGSGSGVGSGVFQVASQPAVLNNFAASTNTEQLIPTTFSVPGGNYQVGSTVRVRVSGVVNVAAGTEFTLSVRPTAAGATVFGALAKTGGGALINGAYPFVLDFMGTIESTGAAAKVHGSAQGSFGVGLEAINQPSNGNFDTTIANSITVGVLFSVSNVGNNVVVNTVVMDLAR
jgi:hypothetical protein